MHSTKQILGLDIVRVSAALLVVLFHLGFAINTNPGGTTVTYHWLDPFVQFGWVGVEIFFVLSGFVISYSASSSTPGAFARSRVLRLYPAAWICATITLLTMTALHVQQERMFHKYFKSMVLYLKGPFIDGSYWTLPLEIAFYLLVLALLCVQGFRFLEFVMTALGVYSAADNLVVWHFLQNPSHPHSRTVLWLSTHPDNTVQSLTLSRYGVFFALGSLVWLCIFQKITPLRACGTLVCLTGAVFEIYRHSLETVVSQADSHNLLWAIPLFVWGTALAVIIASTYYNEALTKMLRPTGAVITRKLGLMTYPLYLVHQQVGFVLIARLKASLGDFVAFLLVSGFLIFTSFIIANFFEKPLRKGLSNLLSFGWYLRLRGMIRASETL